MIKFICTSYAMTVFRIRVPTWALDHWARFSLPAYSMLGWFVWQCDWSSALFLLEETCHIQPDLLVEACLRVLYCTINITTLYCMQKTWTSNKMCIIRCYIIVCQSNNYSHSLMLLLPQEAHLWLQMRLPTEGGCRGDLLACHHHHNIASEDDFGKMTDW